MTLPDWYKNEAHAAELAQLLENPTLKKALDVIEGANRPVFRAGVSPKDLALMASFQAGVHHVARMLAFLTRPPAADAGVEAEWQGAHVVPDFDFDPDQHSNQLTK